MLSINDRIHSYYFVTDVLGNNRISISIRGKCYKTYGFDANNNLCKFTLNKAFGYSNQIYLMNEKIIRIIHVRNHISRVIPV